MISKIISGSFLGTTLMTLFSYCISEKTGREFKEPVLLNKLLSQTYKQNYLPGWLIHYFIGFIFTACYNKYWEINKIDPSITNSSILGVVNGIIGISGWHLMFFLHRNPPSINLKDFYIHLLAAHVLFGYGVAAGHKFFDQ